MSLEYKLGRRGSLVLATLTAASGISSPVAADVRKNVPPQPIVTLGKMRSLSAPILLQKPSPDLLANQEKYKRHYQLALDVMGEFLKTSSDPFIKETYAEALQNPSEHIGIVDNLGYKEYDYFSGGFSYLVFPEERNPFDQETEPAWSFAIAVADQDDPTRTFASVRVQLNRQGDVFAGSTDSLPGLDQVSIEDLSRASDTFFNIPKEMQALPLIKVPGETFLEPPILERAYEGYLQVVTVMGVVMLIAPHPLPQKEDVDGSTVPNIPLPNNPLI